MVNLYHLVAGFVLFSVVILGGVLVIHDFQVNYPEANFNDTEFSEVYNQINATFELSESMDSDALQGDLDKTSIIDTMTLGSFKALRQVRGTVDIFSSILEAVQEKLGIPAFIVKAAIVLFSLAITFTLILLVMRLTQQ